MKEKKEEKREFKKETGQRIPTIGIAVLIIGFMFILLVLAAAAVSAAISEIIDVKMAYICLAAAAVVFGIFQFCVLKKINAGSGETALTNLVSPLLAILLIMSIFPALDTINAGVQPEIKELSKEKQAKIRELFPSETPNGILGSIILYCIVNLFTVIAAIKRKEYKMMLWLLLVPVFFGAAISIGIFGAGYVADWIVAVIAGF